MYLRHSDRVWAGYPELAAGALFAEGITAEPDVSGRIAVYTAAAQVSLAGTSETQLPQIQAWRRAFSRMGLKPTEYRCAVESLLRRYRKQGSLPRLHPLVDLCNAVSLAFAIPVAVLDVARIDDHIDVRHADGDETYVSFAGDLEHPESGEVVFADAARHAHARRWTHRQSAYSAVRDTTSVVLIVAEAMHDSAATDIAHLTETLAAELAAVWSITPTTTTLDRASPRFEFWPSGGHADRGHCRNWRTHRAPLPRRRGRRTDPLR
jgi:DNA/RNA-binding domain of Phe-tRNA-synthetase-like protein